MVAGVPTAGESVEPPRPPTWIVIFFDDAGVSPWPTLSLILALDGSGTAVWALLSSLPNAFYDACQSGGDWRLI